MQVEQNFSDTVGHQLVTCGSSSPMFFRIKSQFFAVFASCQESIILHQQVLLQLQYRNGLSTKENMFFYIKRESCCPVNAVSYCQWSPITLFTFTNTLKQGKSNTHLHVSMFISIRFHACLVLKQSQIKYF